jgi:hypothetical protein
MSEQFVLRVFSLKQLSRGKQGYGKGSVPKIQNHSHCFSGRGISSPAWGIGIIHDFQERPLAESGISRQRR